MSRAPPATFSCFCLGRKTRRLTLDGGATGIYHLELCDGCYRTENRQFVICEERIR